MSDADKQALRNNTAAIKCKIIVLEDGDLPEIVLTEDNSVKDWEYDDERLVPGKGFIGQFVSRTLNGNLQNISDDFDINGREVKLMFGVYRMKDGNENWYDFGNFIITEPEDDEVRDNTKFEAMDYAKLFNKDFNGNYVDDEFTTSYNDLMGVNLTDEEREVFVVTPVTAQWVARYTCKQVGVELATTTFHNYDFEIDINPFQAGESCRDVMKAIGQLALSWVRIGWDNRCYIDFNKNNITEGVNKFNPNATAFKLVDATEETLPTGKKITGTAKGAGYALYMIGDMSDIYSSSNNRIYCGFKGTSNRGVNIGGVCPAWSNADGSDVIIQSNYGATVVGIQNFDYPMTLGYSPERPYFCIALYGSSSPWAVAGDYVTYENIMVTIGSRYAYEHGYEPYGISEYDVLDNNQYYSLKTLEQTKPINAVAFGMKNVDGETAIYAQPGTDGSNCLYLYDNPFLYSFALRQKAANSGSIIFGLTYMQLDTETVGHPWLLGAEQVDVRDMENNINCTYPFNRKIKYSGHIRSQIGSIDETEVEKTLGYTSDVIKSNRQASIEVNKQDGRINMVAGKVDEISDKMGNVYTKSEVNQLIEDAAGLTNRYLTSGGANKFRNTGLWYKEDTASGFEYWTGLVSVGNDSNSASGTIMKLQNSTLTQTLTDIPNGTYTISFKHKKINPTATLTILINSTDYSEKLSSGDNFEQTFDVTTNSIEISFICNVNDGWNVWELMCNVGEVPLVWMQHEDEVRTDTVNISKGITIKSSVNNEDVFFKADYDGIRIENKSENKTTRFLDDGMETDNATIKKQARISGALHTIVGNQTWISGIL